MPDRFTFQWFCDILPSKMSGGVKGERPQGELTSPTIFEESEIKSRIDRTREKIVEHLKKVELDSPRFQAFADYADLYYAAYGQDDANEGVLAYNPTLIAETIRQRRNGCIKGYNSEFERIMVLAGDLRNVLEHKYSEDDVRGKGSRSDLAIELRIIKTNEIVRKNHAPSPPR
jgi:hypothetical protein